VALENLAKYKIQFIQLDNGSHNFDYQLGDAFFEAFENSKITKADISAQVVLTKEQAHMFDLDFFITGKAEMVCDRCLDNFYLPIKNEFNLLVKLTEKERENEHDITYLPMNTFQINIANYLYEIICLAIPMQVKCEDSGEKKCNKEVEKKLNELNASNKEMEIDPRWDELKKLINTDKTK
jgi:uncharacterized protein